MGGPQDLLQLLRDTFGPRDQEHQAIRESLRSTAAVAQCERERSEEISRTTYSGNPLAWEDLVSKPVLECRRMD